MSWLVTVQEEERRRIARDVHDHLGQQVTALHLQIETLKRRLSADSSDVLEQVHRVHTMFKQLDKDLDFSLGSFGLGRSTTSGLSLRSPSSPPRLRNYELPVTFECIGVTDGDLQ